MYTVKHIFFRFIEVTTNYQRSSYRGFYKISGILLSMLPRTIRDRVIEVTYNYQGSIYRGYCELSGIELTLSTVRISHIYELINSSTAHLQPPNEDANSINVIGSHIIWHDGLDLSSNIMLLFLSVIWTWGQEGGRGRVAQ